MYFYMYYNFMYIKFNTNDNWSWFITFCWLSNIMLLYSSTCKAYGWNQQEAESVQFEKNWCEYDKKK